MAERNEAAWPMATEIGCVSVVRDASEWAGAGFDLVVDYAGFDVTTRAAAKAVRRNGRVVLVGMGALEFTLDTMDIIRSQVQLFGSNGGTLSDVAEVYEMLAAGEVNPVVNVIGFDDFVACSYSEKEAKTRGLNRTEGKTYLVKDADIKPAD